MYLFRTKFIKNFVDILFFLKFIQIYLWSYLLAVMINFHILFLIIVFLIIVFMINLNIKMHDHHKIIPLSLFFRKRKLHTEERKENDRWPLNNSSKKTFDNFCLFNSQSPDTTISISQENPLFPLVPVYCINAKTK